MRPSPDPSVWAAVERHAATRPDDTAIVEVGYGAPTPDGRDEVSARPVTYRQLHGWASRFADQLAGVAAPGDAVLLLHASGLDFVAAFLGCARAGMPAVPAPPPRQPYERIAERITGIVEDAEIRVAAAADEVSIPDLAGLTPRLGDLAWLDVGAPPARTHPTPKPPHAVDPQGTAYLQYTSGSTSRPKGVQVTHHNLMAQVQALDDCFRHDRDSCMVSWLPVFHDMGLIYTMVAPLVLGFPSVMMSPGDFVQRPARWLRAIQDHQGTHAIAPNFGYDLCVRKVTEEQRAGLDLRTWRVAADASEPIRAETVERFAEVYEPYGLRPGAHKPAYGLAEATLIVTGVRPGGAPTWLPVDRASLRHGSRVQTGGDGDGAWKVVSCGQPLDGFDVRIVDPETHRELPDRSVGEVWTAGDCITAGYHERPDATAETFEARIAGGPDRHYLRTGDLGFFDDGDLYITGRIKDVLIVRGQNHYPQDLEHVAERAHPGLRPGCGAAFPMDDDTGVGLVYEVRDTVPAEEYESLVGAVRQAILDVFGVSLDAVALLPQRAIPKTSSGKIRRSECGRRLAAGAFDTRFVSASEREAPAPSTSTLERATTLVSGMAPGMLKPTLRLMAARVTGVPASDIDDMTPLAQYGLDSRGAHELAGIASAFLDSSVPPTVVFDHPTVEEMALALCAPAA